MTDREPRPAPARQLLVLRHAMAAWPPGVAALDRALKGRGARAAAAIGRFLAANDLLPDHIACSPAVRTGATITGMLAGAAAAGAHAADVPIAVERELYEGDVFQVLRELPEQARRPLLVGHEPELVDVLHALCGVDAHLPTAALALVELEAPWAMQPAGRGVLRLLITPRLLVGASWATVPAGT